MQASTLRTAVPLQASFSKMGAFAGRSLPSRAAAAAVCKACAQRPSQPRRLACTNEGQVLGRRITNPRTMFPVCISAG